MRYYNEQKGQKGLFTFYREQQQIQQQFQTQRQKLIKAQKQRQLSKKVSQSSTKISPKNKSISQPAIKDESQKQYRNKVHQVGSSIVIINRETVRARNDLNCSRSERDSQKKEKGYFLQYKNMAFQEGQKNKRLASIILKTRKKSQIKQKDGHKSSFSKINSPEKINQTRLPSLAKFQQYKNGERQKQFNYKPHQHTLKSNGGSLLKYIKKNNELQLKQSVSYIQYNKNYLNENKTHIPHTLNTQQKKLLEMLSRYRQSDN